MQITERNLVEKGFVEYPKTFFDSDSVDHCYQKCYRDDLGKKYFLDVKHYNLHHPLTQEDLSGYEVSSQIYLKKNHHAVNLTFLDSDIEEAESFIDYLFNQDRLDYYERKED